MPFNYIEFDCLPLLIDNEFEIIDEDGLASHVGQIILGHFVHVRKIINALSTTAPLAEEIAIDFALAKLISSGMTEKQIEKRDGWIFQIISWLALLNEKKNSKFYCQAPHDAPAQHGLDGIAIILNENDVLQKVIITEDKCTADNQHILIPRIWEEFSAFEKGTHNNKLVSRVSVLIDNLGDGKVLTANQNSIYKPELRQYRVGINRNNDHQSQSERTKLFRHYDNCVQGDVPHRRYASTIHKVDIRAWMEQFSVKIIKTLESLKIGTHV